MRTATSPAPKEKKNSDRIIAIIGLLIALASVIVAVWQGWIANGARRDAQEATRREQAANEQLKTTQQQLEQERAAFCQFAINYRTALDGLRNSLLQYVESSSPDNKGKLLGSVNALVLLVDKWRRAQELSRDLVDGYVDDLKKAAQNGDIDTMRVDLETLSRTADTQLPLLEQQLKSFSTSPEAPPSDAPSGGEISVKSGISCDCNNTDAPNIGGAATRQCLGSERSLKAAAAEGRLKLQIQNGKITSANMALCDSVTQGPAAWPQQGAPAKSPY